MTHNRNTENRKQKTQNIPGRGVVVANGCHRFHLYQAALAYQAAGLLRHLLTGWYVRPGGLAQRLLQSATARRLLGDSLVKRLLARRQEGLDPGRVVSLLLPDCLERLGRGRLERLAPPGFFSYCSMRAFGQRSQPYVLDAAVFHVRSGYGRGAMEQAKRRGAVCLVDHSIADTGYMKEVMEAEAAFRGLREPFPEWHWRSVSQDIDAADHILANSEFVRDTLVASRGLAPERISVLPLPVNLARFTPAADPKPAGAPFRVLFVGEIGLRKGVLYLMEAWQRLRLPGAELIFVGPVAGLDGLFPPRTPGVRYIPVMPQEDVVAHFQQADLFVFPSLIEGSARVVQEAMACGVPVVTTPNAGAWVQDGVEGLIVPMRDADALAQGILRLFENREERRAMGQAALATARQAFTQAAYRDGLVRLYQKLTGREAEA